MLDDEATRLEELMVREEEGEERETYQLQQRRCALLALSEEAEDSR